jgi:hypothetical protein
MRARNLIVLNESNVNLDTMEVSERSSHWDIRRLHHDLSPDPNRSILPSGKRGVEEIELIVA